MRGIKKESKQVLWLDVDGGSIPHNLSDRVKPIRVGSKMMIAGSPYECWYVEEMADGTRNVRVEPIPSQITEEIKNGSD